MSEANSPEAVKQHDRLIDHFKRVYSIVAGLALTEACRRTLPIDTVLDYRLWMFASLFITFVPIFHGGDRSLDQKYSGRPPRTLTERAAFVWDDYMLILTAVLFVCIAESIPLVTDAARPEAFKPARFYFWMTMMFGFDVFVLIMDYAKNRAREEELKPYPAWIILNFALGVVCYIASKLNVTDVGAGTIIIPLLGETTLLCLAFGVSALTLLRTILDYLSGAGFLFPGQGPRV